MHLPGAARSLVGRDGHGNLIVQNRLGRVGGLFASENAALYFAREECPDNPADVCLAPSGIILDFGTAAAAIVHQLRLGIAPTGASGSTLP